MKNFKVIKGFSSSPDVGTAPNKKPKFSPSQFKKDHSRFATRNQATIKPKGVSSDFSRRRSHSNDSIGSGSYASSIHPSEMTNKITNNLIKLSKTIKNKDFRIFLKHLNEIEPIKKHAKIDLKEQRTMGFQIKKTKLVIKEEDENEVKSEMPVVIEKNLKVQGPPPLDDLDGWASESSKSKEESYYSISQS